MTELLRDRLRKQIAFNTGAVPVRAPKGVEEIKLLRVFISIIRQAEDDYLSPSTSPAERVQAEQTLFGLHLSPLPGVCRALGIDCHAARMKLIEWKVKGLTGDPIFDFLTKSESFDQYEKGLGLSIPTLRDEVAHEEEGTYVQDLPKPI
jgi:hypothetical protein